MKNNFDVVSFHDDYLNDLCEPIYIDLIKKYSCEECSRFTCPYWGDFNYSEENDNEWMVLGTSIYDIFYTNKFSRMDAN